MRSIDLKDAVILYLAMTYDRFSNRAGEIIRRYDLTEKDVEQIVQLIENSDGFNGNIREKN